MHHRERRYAAMAGALLMLSAAHPAAHEDRGTSPSAEAATAASQATPEGAVRAFHAALTRGDTAAALALLAEDALIFESGGVERGRAEYSAHHLAADAAFSVATRRTMVERSGGVSGDMAWVTSIETVTGTYRDRPINSRSVETMLLRRAGGTWRIAHIHWSAADIQ